MDAVIYSERPLPAFTLRNLYLWVELYSVLFHVCCINKTCTCLFWHWEPLSALWQYFPPGWLNCLSVADTFVSVGGKSASLLIWVLPFGLLEIKQRRKCSTPKWILWGVSLNTHNGWEQHQRGGGWYVIWRGINNFCELWGKKENRYQGTLIVS